MSGAHILLSDKAFGTRRADAAADVMCPREASDWQESGAYGAHKVSRTFVERDLAHCLLGFQFRIVDELRRGSVDLCDDGEATSRK